MSHRLFSLNAACLLEQIDRYSLSVNFFNRPNVVFVRKHPNSLTVEFLDCDIWKTKRNYLGAKLETLLGAKKDPLCDHTPGKG